jgi:hypothetical protein
VTKDTHFVEEAGLKWLDISNEKYRIYTFPGGHIVKIVCPKRLNVKARPEGDSHRVIAAEETDGTPIAHYVRAGWLSIRWQVHDESKVYEF